MVKQRQKHGLSIDERFWSYVDKTEGCWNWQAATDGNGYGQINIKGKTVWVHRYAYTSTIGPIPEGTEIDHKCRNHSCVRPEHLQAVTRKHNAQNLSKDGRGNGNRYRGVAWAKHAGKWRAKVCIDGVNRHVGYFNDEEEANRAVIAYRREYMENSLSDI